MQTGRYENDVSVVTQTAKLPVLKARNIHKAVWKGGTAMVYNLFISHSWSHSNQCEGLVRLLDNKPGFSYKNYSVPKDDPIHNAHTDAQLRVAIERQMKPASCALILAGVYATYSKWINAEIDLARKMGKRIIAVEYWGSERTSSVVKNAADVVVGWNTDSIVSAIRGW